MNGIFTDAKFAIDDNGIATYHHGPTGCPERPTSDLKDDDGLMLDRMQGNDQVKALNITGAERAFCAGATSRAWAMPRTRSRKKTATES